MSSSGKQSCSGNMVFQISGEKDVEVFGIGQVCVGPGKLELTEACASMLAPSHGMTFPGLGVSTLDDPECMDVLEEEVSLSFASVNNSWTNAAAG
nr:hypothetical protein CFP56_11496 [Quercus suber]